MEPSSIEELAVATASISSSEYNSSITGTRWPRLFILLLLIGIFASTASAQKDTGSIVGTVRDSAGAVVPNARVTIRDEDRGTAVTITTDSSGEYVGSPLKVGRYTVTVEKEGFKKEVAGPLELSVQQRAAVDFVLQIGQVSEVVEVSSAASRLETETSELGQVIDNQRVANLPLNGRNFAQLALLTAGTAPSEPGARDEGGYGFSSNGARSLQNNFLLDGVDNNSNLPDLLNETNFVIQPPIEALQEFKVQTNAYSAEFGRGNGAIINAVIKSGTNSIHGSVFEFFRNEKLDARNFYDVVRQPYKQNQFGFTLGGPVILPKLYKGQNRTFFFVDYEGLRVRQAEPQVATVPTAAQRAGDFSSQIDYTSPVMDPNTGLPVLDCNGVQTYAGEIFNTRLTQVKASSPTGLCGVPFGYNSANQPTNVIPPNLIDPLAARLAQSYPLPNANNSGFNFLADPLRNVRRNNFDIRLDHKFSTRDSSFLRFSYEDQPSIIPSPFESTGGDGGGFFTGVEDNAYHSVALSETHIINSNVVNELRLGYNRINSQRVQFNADRNVAAEIGFPGVPFGPLNGGLPQLTFSDVSTLGSPTFLPSRELQNTYTISDNLTWVRGKHTLKFGTEIRREEFTILQPAESRGTLDFGAGATDNAGSVQIGTGGSGFASFLLGLTDGGAINNIKDVYYERPTYAFYIQDDWKATSKLTLNLGLRYELFTTVKEKHNQQGTYDLNRQILIVPRGQNVQLTPLLASEIPLGATGTPGLIKPDLDNFAPRVGFAYAWTRRLVIRAGYGIFYGGQENGPYSNPSPGFNPPYFITQSFSVPCSAASANPAPGQLDCSIPGLSFLSQGFPSSALTDPNTPILYSIDPGLQTPYMQQWHLSAQYQLPFDTLFEATYAGSKGSRLFTFYNGNQATPTPDPTIPLAPRRPIPSIDAAIQWFRSNGRSNYHSLQLRAEKRLSRGLTFLASYTWSHSLDTASNANLGAQNNGDFRDFRHPEDEYGNSDFDIRHRLVISYLYELPFGRGKRFAGQVGKDLDTLVGGWEVGGITSFSTGNWFTVTDALGFSNADNGGNVGASQRPNLVGDPRAKPCVPGTFFNTCAFGDPPPGSFGNVGRNTIEGPGYQIWDLSIFKHFRINERSQLEFRSEFFNLLNHTNPLFAKSGPQNSNNATVRDTPQFGFLTAARPPRQIQFALKLSF